MRTGYHCCCSKEQLQALNEIIKVKNIHCLSPLVLGDTVFKYYLTNNPACNFLTSNFSSKDDKEEISFEQMIELIYTGKVSTEIHPKYLPEYKLAKITKSGFKYNIGKHVIVINGYIYEITKLSAFPVEELDLGIAVEPIDKLTKEVPLDKTPNVG